MAWIDAIAISSQSTTVTCTRTSVTPATVTESLSRLNSSYGGYTRNTTYEPTVSSWQQGADSGNFTVTAIQNYRVEWYSTPRDYSRAETIAASDYSHYLGSGNTISIPSVEASAHKKVFGTGFTDAYLIYSKYILRYLLTFDANGGTPSTQTQRVDENGRVGTLPAATRDGYAFDGWYTSATGGERITESTVPTEDTTYYAHWTANTYIVIFDPQGGSISDATEYWMSVTMGQPYGTLPTPTRSGYSFNGWYTDATGGARVDQNTIVSTANDHTLYAHWTSVSVQYTLYFSANGGEVSEASRLVYSGTAYGTLPTPAWAYHTFVGWFTEPYGGAQVSAATTMGDDNATIYAHWTDDTTTVAFNGNGGEPSTQTMTYPSGSKYGSLPSATRSGYILTGWFTAATGGTRVEPRDVVSAQPLYAQWLTSGGTAEGVIWNKDTDFVIEMPTQ